MAKFNEKISTILNSQLPEFVVADHPKFAEFLKVYYQLLESAELSVDTIEGTDGITLESETGQSNNLILNSSRKDTARTSLDAGDKLLLEESTYGKFTRGETVTGQTSKATAVILVEDITNNRLIISAQNKFINNEVIVGSSSGAQANITNYKPNPVNNIVDLINFRDPDNVVNHFLTNMRDEFLATLPENLAASVDKRKLIKNIKSMYRSKGSVRGHEIFFRILFGENSETIYPREQMLKASDGQFDSLKVLRVIASSGDPLTLVGRSVTGQSSNATAIIENVSTFQIGDQSVSELILNENSINGTFTVGEEVRGTSSDTDDYFVKANVTGIPGNKNITNDGSLNSTADTISITGGGTGALFQVQEIGPGKITEIVIDNAGTGYQIGDSLTFTNTDTGGNNAAGFVKIVNGGFAGEDNTTGMSTGDRLVLEDETTIGGQYEGKVIVQEEATDLGQITDFFLTNGGGQYTSLPTVVVNSSTGSSATVKAYGDDIGKIVKVKTVELGRGHENSPTPPSLGFFNNVIVTSISGTFITDDSERLINSNGIEVIIEATGNPIVGISHALKCIKNGLHIVMVNVEADVLAGPLIALEAQKAGVCYSLAYGDQPALICEHVDWARAIGFKVVCAGKGTRYLPKFHESTPDTVWDNFGWDLEVVNRGGLNPKMFNSFIDGTKSSIEMTAVCNATGLKPQSNGLTFPPSSRFELADICKPIDCGGSIDKSGTTEVVSSLNRDGSSVENHLQVGTYIIVEGETDYVKHCFEEYTMLPDKSFRFSSFYRPTHLIGLELGISIPIVFFPGIVATLERVDSDEKTPHFLTY
mgnify:CR=1 FL=1